MEAVEAVVIQALLAGRPAPLGGTRRGLTSAIGKVPLDGPIRIEPTGLAGDAQADARWHGGPEKAVYHYAFDYYPGWRAELASVRPPCFDRASAFGENLSTAGLADADVCVGRIRRRHEQNAGKLSLLQRSTNG